MNTLFIQHTGIVSVCSLVHWPLVLEVIGLIPAAGEEIFRCPNMFSLVSFAGMTLDEVLDGGGGGWRGVWNSLISKNLAPYSLSLKYLLIL